MVAASTEGKLRAITSKPYKQRFNVATSRACDQIWLFHTPELNDFSNKDCLRYKLLNYFYNPVQTADITVKEIKLIYDNLKSVKERDRQILLPNPFKSWLEIDLFKNIVEQGYKIIPSYDIAGYKIDFVIEGSERKVVIECDGEIQAKSKDALKHETVLERCGWKFIRIKGSSFYKDPDFATEQLCKELNKHEIYPHNYEEEYIVRSKNSTVSSNPEYESLNLGQIQTENIESKNPLDIDIQEIEKTLLKVLKESPSFSCEKDLLYQKISKCLNLIVRGKTRDSFIKRINRIINHLKDEDLISENNLQVSLKELYISNP